MVDFKLVSACAALVVSYHNLMIPGRILVTAWVCLLLNARGNSSAPLTAQQQSSLARAHRAEKAGWIYLHIEGAPHDRGFQRGYLLAREIAESLQTSTNNVKSILFRAVRKLRVDPSDRPCVVTIDPLQLH